MHACVFVHVDSVPAGARRGCQTPEAEIIGGYQLLLWILGTEFGFLQEQHMLLITEPFL